MRVLATSIGSFGFGPSLIKMLRRSIPDVRIYGLDNATDSAAMHMVDEPVAAPPYGPDEIRFIHTVCRDEKIDVLIALNGDQELLPLLEQEEKDGALAKGGTALVGHGFPLESYRTCIYKDRTYRFLQEQGLGSPAYFTPRSAAEFRKAVSSLGYPDQKVLVKPITGAGNRGLRILDAAYDVVRSVTAQKPDSTVTHLDLYLPILEQARPFPEMLAMEYLPGKEYTVYCLCEKGRPLYVIPCERIKITAGMSLTAQVDLNAEVMAYSEAIIRALGLHGNVDLQMKYNRLGQPILYEINPRFAGSLILPYAAGVDLPHFGILQALGQDVPRRTVRNGVRMIRYADEVFADGDQVYRIAVSEPHIESR